MTGRRPSDRSRITPSSTDAAEGEATGPLGAGHGGSAAAAGGGRPGVVLFLASAAIVAALRLRLLDLPLERDEGEFATMGAMILDGIPPYAEAYNLKPPGIYLAYALVMAVFGRSVEGIHAGLLLASLASGALVYGIASRLCGRAAAGHAAAIFLALSTMPQVLGLSGHATQFLLPPALGGLLCLILARDGDRRGSAMTVAGGLLLGIGALVKQPGVFFLLAGLFVAAGSGFRRVLLLGAGAALPVGSALLWLFSEGVFERFWFWVVTYALEYGGSVGLVRGLDIGWKVWLGVAGPAFLAWGLAGLGAFSLRGTVIPRRNRDVLVALAAASALATAMGLHFRAHYFVLMLPAVALLFGIGVEAAGAQARRLRRFVRAGPAAAAIVTAAALLQSLAGGMKVYGAPTPADASRSMFGANPFVESETIAARIREATSEGDRIAVIGSEPQLYFLSGRAPATGYLYTYSLVERQQYAGRMRDEMISEIERAHPVVAVFVHSPSSWLLRPESDLSIFAWWEEYRSRGGYRLEGIVEIGGEGATGGAWGEDARRYRPAGENYVQIWRR